PFRLLCSTRNLGKTCERQPRLTHRTALVRDTKARPCVVTGRVELPLPERDERELQVDLGKRGGRAYLFGNGQRLRCVALRRREVALPREDLGQPPQLSGKM